MVQRMKKSAPLSLRLDPEMKKRLQELADADRRSLTNYVEMVLVNHLEQRMVRDPKTGNLVRAAVDTAREEITGAIEILDRARARQPSLEDQRTVEPDPDYGDPPPGTRRRK